MLAKAESASAETAKKICGIVMPISAIDNCNEAHWAEVQDILNEAIAAAGFEPNLVSNAEDIGIIQKRIIQNLYDNPIVVCDVSGKNPNVMFELGMRLAFDKPTIIVKDDRTSYSFDTSPIEHLAYPRDLRFSQIVEFKKKLAEKIKATVEKANSDQSYTTFLKHFGEFTVAKIEKKEVSGEAYMIEEIKGLKELILSNSRRHRSDLSSSDTSDYQGQYCLENKSEQAVSQILRRVVSLPAVKSAHTFAVGDHKHLAVTAYEDISPLIMEEIDRIVRRMPDKPLKLDLTKAGDGKK